MLKAGGVVTANALTKEIWETEVVPDVWKTALIVKLPKKGTLVSVMPYYPLRVKSSPECVIFGRISAAVDPLLRREQAGCRKGKSCSDQFFTLRQILELCHDWNTPAYANVIDFGI